MPEIQFLVFPVLVFSLISPGTSNPLDLKTFLRNTTTTGTEPSVKIANRLSKPHIGDDGKIYSCSENNLFSFESKGTIAWIIPLGYTCNVDIPPVSDGRGKISNTEGQLYSLYIRQPHFRWIQDFSLVDKLLTVTPGNNGRLFVTFPRKPLLMALEVSTGNVLWQSTLGPLSMEDTLPVVDSNGWVSISSIDGYLYSFSPNGDLKKFLQKSSTDSVAQVSPVLDCSGFAVYVSQTIMEVKSSHNIRDYTYISAMNPQKLVVTLLAPATGTVYWMGTYPGDLSRFLSKTDLHYFASDERILLTFLSLENQKLSWTCSQGETKYVSLDSDSERTALLFLLLQLVIIFGLAVIVRFCCVFWRKKKLQDHGLGKFLETRHSLYKKRQTFRKMISELEEKVTTNEHLEQLGELVKAKEDVEKKLTTSYSLGRDSIGSKRRSILPLYDGSSRGHSFHRAKKETITIFNTLSDDDDDDSTSRERCISNRNSSETCSSNSGNEEKDIEYSSKGKEIIRAGPSSKEDMPDMEFIGHQSGSGGDQPQYEGILWRRNLLKRRTLSSTN
ncbi:hypothetical protein J5N97_019520 [Dioscorea zingiberensis]|uniref:Protein GAMETE EXPRESSED 3 n=1 Tax=Dioscorea zingiberensis TaxID=325984 RepID=A0A9D5CE50_9LILI|nr:hypothetical protein J5N97_019520 [Dioscorea zingiberensis]